MTLHFKDDAHRFFFTQMVNLTNCRRDPHRLALFYTLGLVEDTRRNINSLYDFDSRLIHLGGINAGWQTGTTTKLTRLAFNLYNGYCGYMAGEDIEDSSLYTPYELFCHGLASYCLEAVKLRYPEYCRDMDLEDTEKEDEYEL